MQLTPRTLTLALGACLAGGLVLGVASVIGSGVAAGAAQPETSPTATPPVVALGDAEITFPSPQVPPISSDPGPVASPSHTTPSPLKAPTESIPSPEAATPDPSTGTKTSPPTQRPRPEPKNSTSPRAQPSSASTGPEPEPRKAQSPRGSWQPPALGIGVVNIGAPRLASGARPDVAVLCIPSTSCSAQGSSLTITAQADTVVVTWTAPASRGWRAWHADSIYSPASEG